MKTTFTLLSVALLFSFATNVQAKGANDNEPFCTRAMNNCIHRGLVETVISGSFSYGVCAEVEQKCAMATFNNFQTLMARISRPHAKEILALAGITNCEIPQQQFRCRKPNFDVNKYNWNGPIERLGYAPVTLKGANSLAILAEAAAKEAALREAAVKAAADEAARKAAEEAARIAAERAARLAAAAKAAAEAAAQQAAEAAAKAAAQQIQLPPQSDLCRLNSQMAENHLEMITKTNHGLFCKDANHVRLGRVETLKWVCGSYYPVEMGVLRGIYQRNCPNGNWDKATHGLESSLPPLSKACTCEAGYSPFENPGKGPACINTARQTSVCNESKIAVGAPWIPSTPPPAGCSCPAGKTYFPFEGSGYCIDPNQAPGVGVELVSCSAKPLPPPPMICIKDVDFYSCTPPADDPSRALAVNITLKNRMDCMTKVAAFSTLYKNMTGSGSAGPIGDANSYCQKMFPEANSPAMPVQFVGMPNFPSADTCEQAMGMAQSQGATFQRPDSSGAIVRAVTDIKAYCAQMAVRPIPSANRISFFVDLKKVATGVDPFPTVKWKAVTLVDGSTGQAAHTEHKFKVPSNYETIRVRMWGAGAGNLGSGGDSIFKDLKAGGGRPAGYNILSRGGQASGGDVNENGNPGRTNSDGGDAPKGGLGAKLNKPNEPAGFPGGGGCGMGPVPFAGGGSGAFVEKIYRKGDLVPESEIQVEVGFAGTAYGTTPCAPGGSGRVDISWTPEGMSEVINDDSGMTVWNDAVDPIVETNVPPPNTCAIKSNNYPIGSVANCTNKPSTTQGCDVGPNMQAWVCSSNGWKIKN